MAAFKLTLITKPLNPNYEAGRPIVLRMSASDVANAAITFDDDGAAAGYTVPVGSGGLYIVDFINGGGQAGVTAIQMKKGTSPTSQLLNLALLGSTAVDAQTRGQGFIGDNTPDARGMPRAPVVLEPGAKYGFIQLA